MARKTTRKKKVRKISPKNRRIFENVRALVLQLGLVQSQNVVAALEARRGRISQLEEEDCPSLVDPDADPETLLCMISARLAYLLSEMTCEQYETLHNACLPT